MDLLEFSYVENVPVYLLNIKRIVRFLCKILEISISLSEIHILQNLLSVLSDRKKMRYCRDYLLMRIVDLDLVLF